MALAIFSGPHPLGGTRTVACPNWDGTSCTCPAQADGSVPAHLEHHWPPSQDPSICVREARLLAIHHYSRPQLPAPGSVTGLTPT